MRSTDTNYRALAQKWNSIWQDNAMYQWEEGLPDRESFIIDTPPPTVSGDLHIGHAFSYTHLDVIARFQRMLGKNVFFPIGFDDNGLPTERLVEKRKNVRAVGMERQQFIELCKEVIIEEEEKFRALFELLGYSFDWRLQYQTISDHTRKISQLSFLDLVNKQQAYRSAQPMLWDPVDQTALAQADVVEKEFTSVMNEIIFTSDNKSNLIIATTRPELLPACVAVFYNPADDRYQHLANTYARSPLFGARVPIIADDQVNIDKGTGLVMCCTFGDMTDILWQKRYSLPIRIVIDKSGAITSIPFFNSQNDKLANDTMKQMSGLSITKARAYIIEVLQANNLLVKRTEIKHNVKCAERSGAPLEILTTPQWFIKTLEHKEALLKISAQLNWHPKHMQIRLDNWIKNLSWDWCISRQRFFGVPIPVWYSKRVGEEGLVILPDASDLPLDPMTCAPRGYTMDEVIPELDVMDTWATSSISPQINSYGISNELYIDKKRHSKIFPAHLRPQAHEIIRTWTFTTILKSYLHQNTLPWQDIMISGWCLAADKTKMSKSKGNVITPDTIVDQYGTDALRYWATSSRLGADTAYSQDVLNAGKRLVNKLQNAARFAAMNFNMLSGDPKSIEELVSQGTVFHPMDLWILSRLFATVNDATKALHEFEYCVAKEKIEHFFWRDFCDNYLEIAKTRSYNSDGLDNLGQQSAIHTLYWCINFTVKLFAPFMPFVTEEIYTTIFNDVTSVHKRASWPCCSYQSQAAIMEGNVIITILDLVRKCKAEKQISIKSPILKLQIVVHNNLLLSSMALSDLRNVTNANEVVVVDAIESNQGFQYCEIDVVNIAILI